VEVGDLQGEVSRIGIRASTVRTYQGADIIVPTRSSRGTGDQLDGL
jgi:small-conductance mechanosensitive channel